MRAHLSTYPPREGPRYKGYTSHSAAQDDYNIYLTQQVAIVAPLPRQPPPRTPTNRVPPSPGHMLRMLSPTPNHSVSSPSNHRGSPATFSPSPAPRPRGRITDDPHVSPVPQASRHAVVQAECSTTPPSHVSPPTFVPAAVRQAKQDLFFVVLHGYNPGVYNSL